MKARGGRFLLILGAGLAAMAFVVVYLLMSKGLGKPSQAAVPVVPKVTVAVIKQDVPAFTALDKNNVVLKEMEATTVQASTTDDPTTLYGKLTMAPMTKEQQIQKSMLSESGFSNVLAKGERAFSLAVSESSTFANGITANDRVDVLWTAGILYYREVPKPEGKVDYEQAVFTSTKTLLQDVKVLRVISLRPEPVEGEQNANNNNRQAPNRSSDPSFMYSDGAPYAAVLILGVTDQQAEVLKFAREHGTIDLTLRSSAVIMNDKGEPDKDEKGQDVRGDHQEEKTTGITIDTLIDKYGVPGPLPNANP